MQLIDLECPACSRVGTAPREKSQGRLVCRKCHTIFHLTSNGKIVLGEPVDEAAKDDLKTAAKAAAPKFDPADIDFSNFGIGSLSKTQRYAIVGTACAALIYLFFPFEYFQTNDLTLNAERVTRAFAEGNTDTIQAVALPETGNDAVEYYKRIRPRLEEVRRESVSKTLLSGTLVVEMNKASGHAEVVGFFKPGVGTARDEAIINDSGIVRKSAELTLHFSKDSQGSWRLDGKRSNESGG